MPHPERYANSGARRKWFGENPLANNCLTGNRFPTIPRTTVPKKTKSQSPTSAAAQATPSSPVADAKPAKAPAKKSAPDAKLAARKTSAKKPARKGVKPAAAKRAPRKSPPEMTEPSDADIRLRAYFIAERRVQFALQGDPALDWIEAKRQLLEEAQQPRS